MSLEYAILGLLYYRKDMTGYLLKANFEGPIGAFWSVSFGGIYPALHKLTEEGLIEVKELNDARNQKVYNITEKGKEKLFNWFYQPTAKMQCKDEHMLKIFLSNDLPKKDQIQLLREYQQVKIQLLRSIKDLVKKKDVGGITYVPIFDVVTQYSYRILENEINVLEELIREMENQEYRKEKNIEEE